MSDTQAATSAGVYENPLSHHLKGVMKADSSRKKQQWLRWNYLSVLPSSKTAKILDIGPGFGEFLELLGRDLGCSNVSAVDYSPEVVAHCNTLIPGSLRAHECRAHRQTESGVYHDGASTSEDQFELSTRVIRLNTGVSKA
jgi:SAM-dependent methyltransferase